jgi:hypothetical protein
MRKRIIVLLISLLLVGTIQLNADTIIDSVYATPELDGDILFRQSIQNFIVFTNYYTMCAGDLGTSLIEPDPNSIFRSYISFYLPVIPTDYELDSAYIRLYQHSSVGDGDVIGNQEPFPLFYGQELPCIMDHIDYGDMLDTSDWTKGDTGDPGTLHSNIGCISDSEDVGYRYLDITQYVSDDYNNDRYQTQYRIRFEVDTDWDNLTDKLGFKTTASSQIPQHPIIYLYFNSIISIDEDVNSEIYNISAYPNPFINSTNISFTARQGQIREVDIYNLKGQLVRTLELRDSDLGFSAEWDGRDEDGIEVGSGVYFYQITGNDEYVGKVVKIK